MNKKLINEENLIINIPQNNDKEKMIYNLDKKELTINTLQTDKEKMKKGKRDRR